MLYGITPSKRSSPFGVLGCCLLPHASCLVACSLVACSLSSPPKLLKMIDYNAVQIRKLSIHQVGNRSKEDGIRLSVEPVVLDNQDTINYLRQYFLSAFNNVVEVFQFSHPSMLDLNEVFTYCGNIFNDEEEFHEQSIAIAR